ncbi:hypothetical protein SAMN05661091_1723 [Paenibacillus uliginis N3/975]|uniref:Uncharacterized protein n=1 Tax=Paenibacillus uliginis N3/975 TaxID=1313296 RepID=A0A1X7H4B4_9BACL|nr:hypothetical protein SAMN05661091_1723 [Paenibacillus uliginis N3/975]
MRSNFAGGSTMSAEQDHKKRVLEVVTVKQREGDI